MTEIGFAGAMPLISTGELADLLRAPDVADGPLLASPVVLVDLDGARGNVGDELAVDVGSLPVVIVGVTEAPPSDRTAGSRALDATALDLVVHRDDAALDAIVANTTCQPIAATSLAILLRGITRLDVDHGLAAESAVYSLLQSGPEFATWRESTSLTPPPDDDGPAAIGDRDGAELRITLNRPRRHNAFSRTMRDALAELLQLAAADASITTVTITGNGPSFCSGGDLGEFGSFSDPATAHRTRLTRSPARLLHHVADRTHVHLHGACLGAGIELPAFAARVTARADARIGLPEISLGLIPGAGGTVSIPRRIGRLRTAYLALSGTPIDAETALTWGLVDAIE